MKSSRRLYGQIHAYIDSTSDVLNLFHVLRQNKLCLYFVLYMLTRSKKNTGIANLKQHFIQHKYSNKFGS